MGIPYRGNEALVLGGLQRVTVSAAPSVHFLGRKIKQPIVPSDLLGSFLNFQPLGHRRIFQG
jgi:hypothetical protein